MSRGLASMPPAYFALVMATGILSIALKLFAVPGVPMALLWANCVFFATLSVLTVIRAVRFPERFRADVMDHARSVGFFTIPAAICVLGSEWIMIGQAWHIAAAFWVAGIVAWAVVTYLILTVLTVKPAKPSLAEGINGGWLVMVVAAQSVSVLGSQLAPGFGGWSPQVLFGSLAMWLGGGMLYIWIIALIFYRYTFFVMQPSDLAPPYWVNMGAVAISTLAGAMLVLEREASPVVRDLLPFVKGLTLMFWSTATWWIPMLAILGLWRHVYRRFPLRYDPLYWGAVFPLGMYTVCTIRLSQALDVPYLMIVPSVFVWISAAAWTMTFVGLVRSLLWPAGAAGTTA
jgi:tellurite resistance protein TehA-like permease